jgi:glycosyltransferase involved in cell wall biosynthesis
VHCHFTGFVSLYPWLAKMCSVEKFFFTDQTSRHEGHIMRPAPLWKRVVIVLSRNPNVQFIIVGDGSFREHYGRLAAELGISQHVTWTGLMQDPLSEGVYAAADVVCLMSRWEELFGLVIAEAMASGKAVIGTRVGGIPESIIDGETGFLVERGDEVAMAEKILRLLDNPALRANMGGKARQVAESKFDHRKSVTKLIELYELRESSARESNRSRRGEPISPSFF